MTLISRDRSPYVRLILINKSATAAGHDAVPIHSAVHAPETPALVLEPTDRAPGHARRFLVERFRELGIGDDYVGRLVVTELVTNVHKHVGHGYAVVRIVPEEGGRRVLIEVWDEGEGLPVLQEGDLTSISGRGLMMMARLVEDWGVRPLNEQGKIVWASVTVQARR